MSERICWLMGEWPKMMLFLDSINISLAIYIKSHSFAVIYINDTTFRLLQGDGG